jgi:hypothetical protein
VYDTVKRMEVRDDTAVVLSRPQNKLREALDGVWRISREVKGQGRRDLAEKGRDGSW